MFGPSRLLFGFYKYLLPQYGQECSLTASFGSTHTCEESFSPVKIIKSRYRSGQADKHTQYCLHLCLSIMNPLSASYRKICGVRHQHRNGNFNETHILIMDSFISSKISIFNKRNDCTSIRSMLLCQFTFLCLAYLVLINCVLWYSAKDSLSLQQKTDPKILATCGVHVI